jgi:large subunit ribosomal protein L22
MIEAHATARYVRTSAQKAKLVLDQIRGRDVNQAVATLRHSPKRVARDIEQVLWSAVANARQREGFGGDVDRLFVQACYADQGPSMKRVRPAPMGRAFRVIKRTAHLTVKVAERPAAVITPPAAPAAAERPAKPMAARGRTGGRKVARTTARGRRQGGRSARTKKPKKTRGGA